MHVFAYKIYRKKNKFFKKPVNIAEWKDYLDSKSMLLSHLTCMRYTSKLNSRCSSAAPFHRGRKTDSVSHRSVQKTKKTFLKHKKKFLKGTMMKVKNHTTFTDTSSKVVVYTQRINDIKVF